MRLSKNASRLKVVLCALTLSVLLPHGAGVGPSEALAQSSGIPGFGGATEKPRMLIIFDTSRSMRFTPDESAEYPNMDYEPPGPGGQTLVCGEADQGSNFTISCPAGQTITSIEYAYYGRKNENDLACGMGITQPTDQASSCDLSNSVQQDGVHRGWRSFKGFAEWNCLGKTNCSFSVENNTLHNPNTDLNPCWGTGKYGVVTALCGDDPCPPGAGSKFCLGKRAVYNVVDSAEPLLEFAVTGYFQQYWEKAIPEVAAGFQTTCKYDKISSGGLWWNNGAPSASPNGAEWTDLTDHSGGASPLGPNATFTCNPESMTSATNLTGGTTGVGAGLNGLCAPAGPARTCNVRWSWQNSFTTTGGAAWNGAYYQHPDATCRTIKPLDPANLAAAVGGACTPALTEPDTRFDSVYNFDTRNVLSSNFGGNCATAPNEYTDRYNATNRLPGPTDVHGSCSAGRPCTYFRYPAGDGNSTTVTTDYYRNHGAAPITLNGVAYTNGPVAQGVQTSGWINASSVGGSCAVATLTGAWGGCSATNPCDVTLNSQQTVQSCPGGFPAPVAGQCTSTRTGRSTGLTGNLSGINFVASATTNWDTYSYQIPLTTYVANGNKCTDESASILITAGTYQGTAVPCAPGTSVTGTHQCQARFSSVEKRTDLGKAICYFQIKRIVYTAQTPATSTLQCRFNRTPYRYTRIEPTCAFRAYRYQYQRKQFRYNHQLAAGDYEGSVLTPNLAYPVTATTPYCSSTPSVAAHSDVAGFAVPSGNSCKAELAPGEAPCPAGVARCKLRWGSAGNRRFENYVAAANKTLNFTQNPSKVGCPVGTPAQTTASRRTSWAGTPGCTPTGARPRAATPTWRPAGNRRGSWLTTTTRPSPTGSALAARGCPCTRSAPRATHSTTRARRSTASTG